MRLEIALLLSSQMCREKCRGDFLLTDTSQQRQVPHT